MKSFNPLDHPVCFSMPRRMTPGTTAWHQHIPFAMALVDLVQPRILVELGTHYGDSYCAFCQAVDELKLTTSCYAVDTWVGDLQSGPYGPEVLDDLKSHHDPLYSSFSRLIKSTFDEAVAHFNDSSIDILHIDGYHTYDSVRHDFETWRPKMRAGGIVLFHDTNVRERDFGIRRFWEEIQVTGPHFEFLNSHGLGVLALGENYPRALRFLFEADESATIKIREFFFFVANLQGAVDSLKDKDQELQNKDIHINNLDRLIQDRELRLSNKDVEIEALVQKVNERWLDIGAIGQQLEYKQAEINSLNDASRNLDQQLQEKQAEITRLSLGIAERDRAIQQILSGTVMRLMMKYSQFVDSIIGRGTRLSRYNDLVLRGFQTIADEGLPGLWRKYKHYRSIRRSVQRKNLRIKMKPFKFKPLLEDAKNTIDAIDKRVSIMIPTKNAGPDFAFTLGKVKNQKGIREVEIVVVDSGSQDSTLDVAAVYGARVFSIDPAGFNHGLTRNYGASQSTGDYILFMVQDAIPIGDYWLYDMVKVLEGDSQIAAVTCRQTPRSDADLFACASLCNHNRALEFSGDGVVFASTKFKDLSPTEKRMMAGLNNVCSLIRKDVFDQFKFKDIQYAEDLDLGLRLRENGYKIAFLYWTGVIHSHNRTATYLLKRNYVDAKFLADILSYDPGYQDTANYDINDVFSSIITLYAALNMSVATLKPLNDKVIDIMPRFKSLLQANLNSDPSKLKSFARSGGYLDDLFDEITGTLGATDFTSNYLLVQSYFDSIDHFTGYVRAFSTIQDKEREFIDALYKSLAIVAGYTLANYYLRILRYGKVSETLSVINSILSAGV